MGALASHTEAARVAVPSKRLPVRIGVIADVQHADVEDGSNYARTVTRHYRGSLEQLGRATSLWNSQAEPLSFVANLGDTIDGQCRRLGQSESALRSVLTHFQSVRTIGGVVHLVGNHELYNFPNRADLRRRLGGASASPDFCSFVVPSALSSSPEGVQEGGWLRVLVLDPYRVCMMSDDQSVVARARGMLALHNPNNVEGEGDWTRGLAATHRHFVPYNGALGAEQLRWLEQQLAEAAAASQRVLVLSHTPLHPTACDGSTMPWDFEKVLDALRTVGPGVVLAVLSGHDHKGGYVCDEMGVHHVTLQSPLNLGSAGESYGILELREDSVLFSGPRLADFLPRELATLIVKESGKALESESVRLGVR